MSEYKIVTGNYASAYGARLAKAEVVSAYPITPQTSVVEKIAEFVSQGKMEGEYVKVESEHSAMASCIAASNTGARTYTATSAHGLALMHEMLMWAARARLPVVMTNVNRAMGPPWSVWADHLDTVAQKGTGWLQFFCENNQEVLDSILMAYKICEDEDIMLPGMIVEDAFILSHTREPVEIYDQEKVDEFLPPYDPEHKLDIEDPKGFGSLVMPDWYMDFAKKLEIAMNDAKDKVKEVNEEFEETFGRDPGGLIEEYKTDGVDVLMITMGSISGTSKDVIDELRDDGYNIGLARLRTFRPFPKEEIRELMKDVNVVGILDRSYSFGRAGDAAREIKEALYGHNSPIVKNYIVGLGGRDLIPDILKKIMLDSIKLQDEGLDQEVEWVDLRSDRKKWRR
ncbi:MAG: transketolase C-terminal domain-containing protein [Candidatus Natronoplasma sp.]